MKRMDNKLTIKQRFGKTFASKAFKVGTYSAFISIAALVICVAINLLVSKLPANLVKKDMTGTELYTIGDQTKEILSSLDEKVTVYYICENGSEDSVISEMLAKYAELSGNIEIVQKDPVIYPNFAAKYTDEAVAGNSLIVESDKRSKFISVNDIYVQEYDYSSYYTTGNYTTTTSYNGEGMLTSAIDYVTSDKLPKIYYLTGHGESELGSGFTSSCEQQNIELQSLSLLSLSAVPEDASCVMMIGAESDISDSELDMLNDYFSGGGNLLIFTQYTEEKLENIALLLQNLGLEKVEGLLIEGDADYHLSGYNYYLIPGLETHAITDPLIETRYSVLIPFAQGLRELSSYRSSLGIVPILQSSEAAYSKTAGMEMSTTDKEDGDIEGKFILGAAVTESFDGYQSKAVVYSSTEMLVEEVNEAVSGANLDLFINSIGWMCEHESSISIHSKSLDAEYLSVTASDVGRWSIIAVGLVPLAYLGIGIGVYLKRKSR